MSEEQSNTTELSRKRKPIKILHAEHPQAFCEYAGTIHLLAEPCSFEIIQEGNEYRWPSRPGRAPVAEGLCTIGLVDPIEVTVELLEELTEGHAFYVAGLYCAECLEEIGVSDGPARPAPSRGPQPDWQP